MVSQLMLGQLWSHTWERRLYNYGSHKSGEHLMPFSSTIFSSTCWIPGWWTLHIHFSRPQPLGRLILPIHIFLGPLHVAQSIIKHRHLVIQARSFAAPFFRLFHVSLPNEPRLSDIKYFIYSHFSYKLLKFLYFRHFRNVLEEFFSSPRCRAISLCSPRPLICFLFGLFFLVLVQTFFCVLGDSLFRLIFGLLSNDSAFGIRNTRFSARNRTRKDCNKVINISSPFLGYIWSTSVRESVLFLSLSLLK